MGQPGNHVLDFTSDVLLPVRGSRVVTVSSSAHRIPSIHFDDLQWERRYDRFAAHSQSKLANPLFTDKLQRRLSKQPDLKKSANSTISVAAHPGSSKTELVRHLPGVIKPAANVLAPLVFQSAAMGALPTLRAATDPAVVGAQYYGPDGLGEQLGRPKLVDSNAQSLRTTHRRQVPSLRPGP